MGALPLGTSVLPAIGCLTHGAAAIAAKKDPRPSMTCGPPAGWPAAGPRGCSCCCPGHRPQAMSQRQRLLLVLYQSSQRNRLTSSAATGLRPRGGPQLSCSPRRGRPAANIRGEQGQRLSAGTGSVRDRHEEGDRERSRKPASGRERLVAGGATYPGRGHRPGGWGGRIDSACAAGSRSR